MDTPSNKGYCSQLFGVTSEGLSVEEYTLMNRSGMSVSVITYGAIISKLLVPGRNGSIEDVVTGYETLYAYELDTAYFGAIVGRYGNRIAGGTFNLDSETYKLAQNNGTNSLHGGLKGFNKQIWKARPFEDEGSVGVVLTYISADGEEGFPGNLRVELIYKLSDANELSFEYRATCDKATVCNLTQHTYFNLAGHAAGSISDHILKIYGDHVTPVNENLIPTGVISEVENTPFDFREGKAIGLHIDTEDAQLTIGGGYDHNWVLRDGPGIWGKAAELFEPVSGRLMEVWTTEPGIQFYSGNALEVEVNGKAGASYTARSALALETQHYPDSPNQADFPSTRLNPGETYQSKTSYQFSII